MCVAEWIKESLVSSNVTDIQWKENPLFGSRSLYLGAPAETDSRRHEQTDEVFNSRKAIWGASVESARMRHFGFRNQLHKIKAFLKGAWKRLL